MKKENKHLYDLILQERGVEAYKFIQAHDPQKLNFLAELEKKFGENEAEITKQKLIAIIKKFN